MSSPPRPTFDSNYPRPDHGNLAELERYIHALRLVTRSFLAVAVIHIVSLVLHRSATPNGREWPELLIFVVGMMVCCYLAVWSARAYAISIGANLNVATILGFVGPFVPCMILVGTGLIQKELVLRLRARYRVRHSFFVLNRKDLREARAKLTALESS